MQQQGGHPFLSMLAAVAFPVATVFAAVSRASRGLGTPFRVVYLASGVIDPAVRGHSGGPKDTFMGKCLVLADGGPWRPGMRQQEGPSPPPEWGFSAMASLWNCAERQQNK